MLPRLLVTEGAVHEGCDTVGTTHQQHSIKPHDLHLKQHCCKKPRSPVVMPVALLGKFTHHYIQSTGQLIM